MKKYELTNETREFNGKTLHRIKALIDFKTILGDEIHAGDLGGFVESENNLSHDGTAWVSGRATVSDHAVVFENAVVSGYGVIGG